MAVKRCSIGSSGERPRSEAKEQPLWAVTELSEAVSRRSSRVSSALASGHAEVGFADFVGGGEGLGVVGHLDLAALEDVAAVRHRERHVGVLLDEQDGDALLVDLADDDE